MLRFGKAPGADYGSRRRGGKRKRALIFVGAGWKMQRIWSGYGAICTRKFTVPLVLEKDTWTVQVPAVPATLVNVPLAARSPE